jgi:hypothetical protein
VIFSRMRESKKVVVDWSLTRAHNLLNEVRRRRRGKTGAPLGCSGIRRSREKGKEREHRELWEVVVVVLILSKTRARAEEKDYLHTNIRRPFCEPRDQYI